MTEPVYDTVGTGDKYAGADRKVCEAERLEEVIALQNRERRLCAAGV